MAAIQDPVLGKVISDLAYVFEGATQVPVLENTITFDTGGLSKTEVKLTTKQIITSTIEKDDSDISYDVVYSMGSAGSTTDALAAVTTTGDVTFFTRDKKASVKIVGATLSKSYQYSDDGVLVQHTIVTPSASGIVITTADAALQAPSAS